MQLSAIPKRIVPLRIAVTGEERFARRHAFLFEAIAERCLRLDYVTTRRRTAVQRATLMLQEAGLLAARVAGGTSALPHGLEDFRLLRRRYLMTHASYKTKTLQTERLLRSLSPPPDVVFHIFNLFRPFWHESRTPTVHYLDYTAAMLRMNWPPNLAPMDDREFAHWLEIERTAYDRSAHLFAMSEAVAASLRNDYGIPSCAITVVGSAGQFRDPYCGPKKFGSLQLLFNAKPFTLKGGDVALAAFEIVRRKLPSATLVVVGTKLERSLPGVINPGFVSHQQEMRELFLGSDLVVAPARADAFPGFLIEAMSHGVPCVASPVGGVAEIVADGTDGILLDSLDPEHLADVLVALLSDGSRLQALSSAAHQKALERYTWAAVADRIVRQLATPCENGRTVLPK